MYQLTTTAGRNTTAHTIAAAAATLAQHLQDTAPDGAVHWKITTPLGTTHAGHVNRPTPAFLADTIAEITRNLADESSQAPTKALRSHAAEFTVGDAVRIRVTVDLDVVVDDWAAEYGLDREEVPTDAQLQLTQFMEDAAITRATQLGTVTVTAAAGGIV